MKSNAPSNEPPVNHVFATSVWLAIGLSFLVAACASPESRDYRPGRFTEDPLRCAKYNAYQRGIPIAELSISIEKGEKQYSIRHRNLRDHNWFEWHHAPVRLVASNPHFVLSSATALPPSRRVAVASFAQDLDALQDLIWDSGVNQVSVSDGVVYDRLNATRHSINGNLIEAYNWQTSQFDAVSDLTISQDGVIIAASDLTHDAVFVCDGYEQFTSVAEWQNRSVSQPDYGYQELGLQTVRTRDGGELSTLVMLPKKDGPFPTILIRTPYGVSNAKDRYAHFAIRGYAVVLQSVRGTSRYDQAWASPGEFKMMTQEAVDGSDTISWVTAQSWSDGTLCMHGLSYYGFTQWTAAMSGNPALRCLNPESTLGTAFTDQPYFGGILYQGLPFYVFWLEGKELKPGLTWSEVLRYRPLIQLDEFATGFDIPLWNEMVENSSNNEYWAPQDWHRLPQVFDIPSLQISGWFDDDFPGTESNWFQTQRRNARSHLIVGGWWHSINRSRLINGFETGDHALRRDIDLIRQKWFDYHLKDYGRAFDQPKVEYFVLGADEWRESQSWPPSTSIQKRFYLVAESADGSGGRLLSEARHSSVPIFESYVFDPKNPPQNWTNFDALTEWRDVQTYPADMTAMDARSDVKTYTTDAFDHAATLAGPLQLILFASTDVKDTDWWVSVSVIRPDGSSTRLSLGSLRARFRHLDDPIAHAQGSNFQEGRLLSGNINDIEKYEIRIPSFAYQFKPGEKLRVSISNGLEGYGFVNSQTGSDEAFAEEMLVSNNRIYVSEGFQSQLVTHFVED